MSKQLALNLFLFIVVISLAAIIYFSEEENTQLQRLSDIKLDNINTITIQHNNRRIIINKTETDDWQINQPVNVAANNFRINSILKLLNAPIHNQYKLDEINIEKIGLSNPTTSIQFNHQLITFGIRNPVTNLRFIKLNQKIYTIEDVYSPLISSHFGALVSLNLLPPDSTITKLVLLNQTINKDESGRWQSSIEMNPDHVAQTLQRWLHSQAFGIHQYLPRKELGEVLIYVRDSAQAIRFLITDIEPWLIIARPELGLEYHLDAGLYSTLIAPTGSDSK